jgi:SAM-dependent methyltransferase
MASECPLCASSSSKHHESAQRTFLRCDRCLLVFVPPQFHLSREEERAVYELHENDPADPRYRLFLSRLFTPLRKRLAGSARGLDFGCGPGRALSTMFRESGIACEDYDPFFANDPTLLTRTYDFITCTEVFEHLREPAAVIAQLFAMLRPGGILSVMTKRVTPDADFAAWHYIRDPTHIAFFADETFRFIGERHHATVTFESKDVVLLQI